MIRREHIKSQREMGFTLVELLLVVALMAISFGVTSDILVSLMRSFNKTTVINEIEQQAGAVAGMIEKEIKNASSISNPSGNTNILQFTDSANNITNYSYENSASTGLHGTLYRYPGGTDMADSDNRRKYSITTNLALFPNTVGAVNVSCSGGCFRVSTGRPSVVQMDLTFNQAQATANNSYKGRVVISQTIVARNTY